MSDLTKDVIYPFGLSGNQFLSRHNSIYIQSELLSDHTIRVIEGDIEKKWMKVREKRENEVDWKEMNSKNVKKGDILDLNENGMRWEGDSLNGIAFGYGCIYNEENLVIFSGFVFKGKPLIVEFQHVPSFLVCSTDHYCFCVSKENTLFL